MKKRWILPMVIGVAVTAVGVTRSSDNDPITVKTVTLQTQRVEKTISCNGVVVAGEFETVTVPQTCVVDKVLVEVGQRVKAGESLITIDKEATRLIQAGGDRVADALSLTTMKDEVVAKESGVVVSVEAVDGLMLDPIEPCVVIAPDSGLQVQVMIREKQLPVLEIGQQVRISGVGFDKSVYYGCLSEISSAVSENAGSEGIIEGVITLNDGEVDDSMRLGLTAKAKVVVSAVEQGLLIPYEAIIEEDSAEQTVYFVQGGRVKRESIDPQGDFGGGILVSRTDWVGRSLVLEPDRIVEDGQLITEVREDAR